MANLHAETLPTIADILSSSSAAFENRTADAGYNNTITKSIGGGFVAKYGRYVPPSEAETMRFVAENTSVKVPKVVSTMTEASLPGIFFMVMEFIPGATLQDAWDDLNMSEREGVCKKVRGYVDELR